MLDSDTDLLLPLSTDYRQVESIFKEIISAGVIYPPFAAIPFGFIGKTRTAAARHWVPIDGHVAEGDIDRFPPTIISAAVQGALFYHHKMHMIAVAVTGIIYTRDCLALKNISTDLANIGWHAALRDMQIDIVGVRRRGAILDCNAISARGIPINTRILK